MYQHESAGRKRARDLITRTGHHLGKAGGHMGMDSDYAADKAMIEKAIHEHDAQLHGGAHTKLKLATGGVADGAMMPGRADRAPRGKGRDAKNHIAIVIAPQGGQQQPPRPVPVPVPMPPPPGGPMAGPPPMPPRPPMPMPGGPGGPMPGGPMMGGMPPGAPMMRKAGGSARRKPTGGRSTAMLTTPPDAQQLDEKMPMKLERPEQEIETAEGQKAGGRSRHAGGGRAGRPEMTAGQGSGAGRLEQSKALAYCAGGRS